MPLTLQGGRRKLVAFTTDITADPADPEALSLADLTAGIDIQCKVLKSDLRLSPTASDTVPDSPYCATGNATVFGASNYEGSLTPFAYYDATGALDATEGDVFALLTAEKGAHIWIVDRWGKPEDEPLAAGDDYRLWHVITDEGQDPTDVGGYIKQIVPLGVQRMWRGTIAA